VDALEIKPEVLFFGIACPGPANKQDYDLLLGFAYIRLIVRFTPESGHVRRN